MCGTNEGTISGQETFVLIWNCSTGLFCLSSSLLHHGLHGNPSVPMAVSGWDMASSKKCSETPSQGLNCPKILKTGQASAQGSSHVAAQRAHKNLPVSLSPGMLLVSVSKTARLGVKCSLCCFSWHDGSTDSTGHTGNVLHHECHGAGHKAK